MHRETDHLWKPTLKLLLDIIKNNITIQSYFYVYGNKTKSSPLADISVLQIIGSSKPFSIWKQDLCSQSVQKAEASRTAVTQGKQWCLQLKCSAVFLPFQRASFGEVGKYSQKNEAALLHICIMSLSEWSCTLISSSCKMDFKMGKCGQGR